MMRYLFVAIIVLAVTFSCGGRGRANRPADREVPVASATPVTPAAAPDDAARSATAAQSRPPEIKQYTYQVVNTYPHDTKAYTQGLFWHDGHLYESTGQRGESELRKVEPRTGNVVRNLKLERKYFGEGSAILNGDIYLLTWEEGKAFVYDASDFRLKRTFSYDGEGWGLTSDGEKLYMSNGSHYIFVRDAATFSVIREMSVMLQGRPLRDLNELEWVEGEIWANVYWTEQVVRIDPRTGFVTGVIDFSGIRDPKDITARSDVFNGIAYDPATGNIYVTGKYWNKLYQVEVIEK